MDDRLREHADKAKELSRLSGVGKSTINRYLNPEGLDYAYPGLDKILKIALVLGIKSYELLLDAASARDVYGREAQQLRVPEEPVQTLKSR